MHPNSFQALRRELRAMLTLAGPIVVVQVGMMAMGVVDTVMVGHLSSQALAAVAIGNLYFYSGAIFGMGTLMALDPVIAQAVGARDHLAVARGVQRGMILAVLLSIPTAIFLLVAGPLLQAMRQPAELVQRARDREEDSRQAAHRLVDTFLARLR